MKASDLLEFFSTNSLSWEQLEYGGTGLLNLHYGLIHNGLPTQIDINDSSLPTVKAEFEPRKFTLCEKGDIAFADASEDTNDVGKVVEFADCAGKDVVCGLHTIHGRDKLYKTVPGFKGYAFSSKQFHDQIKRIAQGTKVFSISAGSFDEVSVSLPGKDEQVKIAALLSLIDQRISIQSRVIEKYESLIKALIDRQIEALLSGTMLPFEQLYIKAGEGGTPSTAINEYYRNGSIPFIKIDDLSSMYLVDNKDFITEKGIQKSSAWLIPEGSVIYSNGATIGAVSINKYPVATKQGILGIVPKKNVFNEYLYFLMRSTYFSKEILRIVTEGTMKTAYLKDINRIQCPLPPIETQHRIVSGLLALAENIDLEKQILGRYESIKQTLLKNMFI